MQENEISLDGKCQETGSFLRGLANTMNYLHTQLDWLANTSNGTRKEKRQENVRNGKCKEIRMLLYGALSKNNVCQI